MGTPPPLILNCFDAAPTHVLLIRKPLNTSSHLLKLDALEWLESTLLVKLEGGEHSVDLYIGIRDDRL